MPGGDPSGQPFSTKLPHEEILVRVQKDHNSEFIALLYDLPQSLNVSVVVDSSFRLEPFPSSVQADHVHAPVLQVI